MLERRQKPVNRRQVLRGGAAAAAIAAAGFPAPAIAQATKVKFGLSWVPEGGNLFTYLARNKGLWRKNGLDVEIFTGRGSVAAAQNIGTGQYEFGIAAAPAVMLQLVRGLEIAVIGQSDYVATMGIGVLESSPIQSPKDLEGKRLGGTATSGEFPLLPAFFKKNNIDPAKVEIVQMDNQVRERSLIEKQVDAISGFGNSIVPPLVSRGIGVRFMMYADYGLEGMYSQAFLTQPAYLQKNRSVCEAFVDGCLNAIQSCFEDPEAAIDIFMREVPETAMKSGAKEFLQLGLGLYLAKTLGPETLNHGLGYMDPKQYETLADLTLEYIAKDGKKPDISKVLTNDFTGKLKLTPRQISNAEQAEREVGKYLKIVPRRA